MKKEILNKEGRKNRREKNYKKLFTKKETNNIISRKYNPLNKDKQRFYESEGLFMRETEDVVLNELMEELNF